MRPMLTAALLAATGLPAAADVYGDCVIEPAMVVEIGAPVEGVVERIEAPRGAAVRKGDPIAWLEATIEEANLALSERQAQSDADVRIAEARVELAQKEAARARELVSRNVGTVSDLDIAEAELKTAKMEMVAATEDRELAALSRDRAAAILEMRTIKSPIDGIILRRLIGPGEFAHSQAQIAQIAAIDPLYVDVFLPTSIYRSVRIGQNATVLPAEPIGGSYEAVIQSIDQVFDAASDTFSIRLSLPNPDHALPAGVDCAVSLGSGN